MVVDLNIDIVALLQMYGYVCTSPYPVFVVVVKEHIPDLCPVPHDEKMQMMEAGCRGTRRDDVEVVCAVTRGSKRPTGRVVSVPFVCFYSIEGDSLTLDGSD